MPGMPSWPRELWAKASLIDPMAIRVAATLRLPDLIAAGRRTTSELADATDTHTETLERLLRHLVTIGILRVDDHDQFTVTEQGEQLRGDDPDGVQPWLDLDGPFGDADRSAIHLLHTVRTGEAAFPAQFGHTFWEYLSSNPDRSATFTAMLGSPPFEADAVAAAYDWAELGSVVDVGGGNGALLIALLTKHAELTGTLLELPGPAQAARDALHAAGLTGRAQVVTGSFVDPLPPGAGGYVLSAIVHNCTDADARGLLRRCAEAAGPTGRVLVVEAIDSAGERAPFTEMDLRMLAYMGGRERNLDELTALATDAGLAVQSVRRAGYRSIIEMIIADEQSPL